MSVSYKLRQTQHPETDLRLAVSACLMGQKVRYDGADKLHAFVTESLARWVELIPVCPEVEIGMGVPRPPIQVVEANGRLRAVGVDNPGLDVTREMNRFGRSMARRLANIDGYIFKARSPSCGVASTPLRRQDGGRKRGAGLFAARIMHHLPLLPVVEEGALESPEQRVNFIQRVEAYRRWRIFAAQNPGRAQLNEYHRQERLILMAHGAEGLRQLEQRLATLEGRLRKGDLETYGLQYMRQMARQATRRRHGVALRHIAAQCSPGLDKRRYLSLRQLIDGYVRGDQRLAQVLAELRQLPQDGPLAGQSYLQPGLSFKFEA